MALNSKNDKRGSESLSSIIGSDASLEGALNLEGSLRIDGTFSGRLKCGGGVSVGKHGHVTGDIDAEEVILGGQVKGTILARRRIVFEGSSSFEGELATGALLINEGAVFNGISSMGEEAVEKLRARLAESNETLELPPKRGRGKSTGEPGIRLVEDEETAEKETSKTAKG